MAAPPGPAGQTGAETARLLLEAGAIQVSREQPFVLAAGWASPVYVDCRLLIDRPEWRRAITRMAAESLDPASFDIIAGAETAGIPWASWLAEALDKPLRYVRKRPLGIGRNAQVEGGGVDGQRVLLVDDLTTDGSSKLAFARGLRAAGAEVNQAFCIFHHGAFPGGAERLARLGLTLHPLATWADVLALGSDAGMDAEDRAEMALFLQDPVAWSTAHGGRATLTVPPL
ncbi:orotate phosphoribosyltransferase (plasmid) [Roseomonas marmotae]|uniref:Orotate phosphoribosyltransferase n=2 Tax=Roseomonas marmotae TaxID=2768161 RepID=A0ABS3KEM9_9PROT|nr:orotate phosphoribosyltransferase [Roseomonas marmotae]QTI82021.1 orotate phosphoribosyltransferase [Roseomonas marmotae]